MLSVAATGVREGETLVSIREKQNVGSKIVLHKKGARPGDLIYPPLRKSLALYEKMGGTYDDMQTLDFFAEMTPEQVKDYLHKNAVAEELYLSDLDLLVKPLALTGSAFAKIPPEQLTRFLQSPPFPLAEIYNAIPRKPGSKARRHTLVFRPSIWAVVPAEKNDAIPDADIIYDIDELALVSQHSNKGVFSIKLFQDAAKEANFTILRVLYDVTAPPLAIDDLSVVRQVLDSEDREPALATQVDAVRVALGHLSPAYMKSAMQKILRTGADKVMLQGTAVDGDVFLVMSFLLLFRHPGSFVPDIQTFVRGAESALKRLAVSINEDAFTDDYEALVGLYVAALVVQRHDEWRPPHNAVVRWLEMAVRAHSDERCFQYTIQSRDVDWGARDQAGTGIGSPYHVAYVLLDELRSFESDINMLAHTDGAPRPLSEIPLFDSIPLEHIVDQHTTPEIFYMLPDPHEESYNALQKRIFRLVTGLNPRRGDRGVLPEYFRDYEEYEFTKQVREAERFILASKDKARPKKKRVERRREEYSLDYTLSDSWLAGMAGVSEVKHGPRVYYASISITDIFSYDVVAKPQRAVRGAAQPVDDAIKKAVTTKYIALLEKGIPLAAPRSLPWLARATVKLVDGEYMVRLVGGRTEPWDKLKIVNDTFPVLQRVPRTTLASISYEGKGVEEGADASFDALLDTLEMDVMRRLATFLSGNRSEVEMLKVNKQGYGQELVVKTLDSTIYAFFDELTLLYPAAFARSQTSPTKVFDVLHGPLFWTLKGKILARLRESIPPSVGWKLGKIDKTRKLFDYQERAAQRMLNTQRRGSILFAPTGIGKTFITLTFIRRSIERGTMPPYCLYTLPASAMSTIKEELQLVGLPYRELDMRKPALRKTEVDSAGRKVYLRPYEVTLVKHDHMRLEDLPDFVNNIADRLLLVVDEFHKAMSNSIRTSVVLSVMRLCLHFVAMSATVIRDTHLAPVIAWLEPLVDFEVTDNNFWVAANGMIALTVRVPVVVRRHEEMAHFTAKEEKEYTELLSGRVGMREFNMAIALCYAATERSMISKIKEFLPSKRGVFCIARNKAMAERIMAAMKGVLRDDEMHMVTSATPVNLKADTATPIRLLITTPQHSEGYNATRMDAVVQCVYFSNQTVREQLDGRTVRIGQDKEVDIVTIYVGLLQAVWERYAIAGSISAALKSIAELVGLEQSQMRYIE